ncbi:MAG: hypothetical protein JOZ05_10880, partial [Acetobacteraceae bacterium]|nr:hypothetical protein [Acetobacteraceae bacterium]
AIAGFLASATHAFGDVLGEIVQTLVFFALCAVCFRGTGRVASVFAWTPLRWLGNMSYSYYLIHGFVVRVAMLMLGAALPTGMPEWVFWAVLPLLFGATLVVAALLFVLIEKPYSLRPAASKVTQPALI